MRLLILVLIFVSCSTKYENERPSIGGDWIYVENPNEITVNDIGLRFENDTLYTIQDLGLNQEGSFSVSGDTIIVREFGDQINKGRRIRKLTEDSLILIDGAFDKKYYSRKLEFSDNLKLNDLKIVAEGCFGECPEFAFLLTHKGRVHFKPTVNCKVYDEQEFTLDRDMQTEIDSLFQWAYLHKLDTNKVYGAVDDWAINIEIAYNNGEKIEFRTTHSYIPFRLKRIFELLIYDLRERELI